MCSERVNITQPCGAVQTLLKTRSCHVVTFCGRRSIFVRVGGVEGAGGRDVAPFGGGECRCATGIGVSAAVALRGWDWDSSFQS